MFNDLYGLKLTCLEVYIIGDPGNLSKVHGRHGGNVISIKKSSTK